MNKFQAAPRTFFSFDKCPTPACWLCPTCSCPACRPPPPHRRLHFAPCISSAAPAAPWLFQFVPQDPSWDPHLCTRNKSVNSCKPCLFSLFSVQLGPCIQFSPCIIVVQFPDEVTLLGQCLWHWGLHDCAQLATTAWCMPNISKETCSMFNRGTYRSAGQQVPHWQPRACQTPREVLPRSLAASWCFPQAGHMIMSCCAEYHVRYMYALSTRAQGLHHGRCNHARSLCSWLLFDY